MADLWQRINKLFPDVTYDEYVLHGDPEYIREIQYPDWKFYDYSTDFTDEQLVNDVYRHLIIQDEHFDGFYTYIAIIYSFISGPERWRTLFEKAISEDFDKFCKIGPKRFSILLLHSRWMNYHGFNITATPLTGYFVDEITPQEQVKEIIWSHPKQLKSAGSVKKN